MSGNGGGGGGTLVDQMGVNIQIREKLQYSLLYADDTINWVSDSEAVTTTVGRQQDQEENAVAAPTVGQIPAAEHLRHHVPGRGAKVKGLKVKEVTREKKRE